MSIEIVQVKSKNDLKVFIKLPAKIHKGHKNWVPPIYLDDWFFFDAKKNKSFSYCDTILNIAIKDGKPAGRIMGIINHKYNEAHGDKDGRFCFLETFDDLEVATALLQSIENWARLKGMRQMVGPLGFSDKDPQGFMIEGFEHPIVIATQCNYPYLVNFIEKSGFEKKVDLFVFKLNIPNQVPAFYRKIYEHAIQSNPNLRMIEFTRRRQLKPYIRPVFHLMNETYKEIYAFALLDEQEMDEFAGRYLMVLDPRFIKVIENEKNEVVAFILAMPDISNGIRKSKGHLFPFGIFQIYLAQRKTRQLNLLLGAIRKDFRNCGLDTIIGVKMIEESNKAGLTSIDSHLILETNVKMQAEVVKMGGEIYKKYRIFKKNLN